MENVGYIRSSTKEQKHTPAAQEALLRRNGYTVFFKDEAVSSDSNLTTGAGWLALQAFLEANPHSRVGVTRQDRLGREWDLVTYAIGQLIRAGHSLHVLDPELVIDNLEDLVTNFRVALTSVTDKDEKTRIRKRTNEALTHLKNSGVKLGRKPLLTLADCQAIRAHAEANGLGARGLARDVTKTQVDPTTGKLVEKPVAINTLRKVLTGTYFTEDEWLEHNRRARAGGGLRLSATGIQFSAKATDSPDGNDGSADAAEHHH